MKKLLIVAVLLLGLGFTTTQAFACGGWFEASCDQPKDQQQVVQDTATRLRLAVPEPQLTDSLERKNIGKRLQLFSNPSKVSYIYLISYGKVMAFYAVKGKITSSYKRMTDPQQVVGDCGYQNPCTTTDQPELDGTYGSSDPYIYFWTTDGTYVQWNGEYMMADQPLQLATPPELVQTVK